MSVYAEISNREKNTYGRSCTISGLVLESIVVNGEEFLVTLRQTEGWKLDAHPWREGVIIRNDNYDCPLTVVPNAADLPTRVFGAIAAAADGRTNGAWRKRLLDACGLNGRAQHE